MVNSVVCRGPSVLVLGHEGGAGLKLGHVIGCLLHQRDDSVEENGDDERADEKAEGRFEEEGEALEEDDKEVVEDGQDQQQLRNEGRLEGGGEGGAVNEEHAARVLGGRTGGDGKAVDGEDGAQQRHARAEDVVVEEEADDAVEEDDDTAREDAAHHQRLIGVQGAAREVESGGVEDDGADQSAVVVGDHRQRRVPLLLVGVVGDGADAQAKGDDDEALEKGQCSRGRTRSAHGDVDHRSLRRFRVKDETEEPTREAIA